MSLQKKNETTWIHGFPTYGEMNDEHEIEITPEGINIDCVSLTWAEIDRAREIALERSRKEPA